MNDRRMMLSVDEIIDLGGVEVTDLLDIADIPIKELLVPVHTSALEESYTIKFKIVIDKQYTISEYRINLGYDSYLINSSSTMLPDSAASFFNKTGSGLTYQAYVGYYSSGNKYYSVVTVDCPYKSFYNTLAKTTGTLYYYNIETVDKMYLPIKPRYVNVTYKTNGITSESISSSSDRFSFILFTPSAQDVAKYTVPIYYIPA